MGVLVAVTHTDSMHREVIKKRFYYELGEKNYNLINRVRVNTTIATQLVFFEAYFQRVLTL